LDLNKWLVAGRNEASRFPVTSEEKRKKEGSQDASQQSKQATMICTKRKRNRNNIYHTTAMRFGSVEMWKNSSYALTTRYYYLPGWLVVA
jgi:hypothetical protein